MLENTLANTITSANERPPDGNCLECGVPVAPFLRPPFLGLSARWLPPNSLCSTCAKQRENHERILKEQQTVDEAFRTSRMSLRFKERTFENFIPETNTKTAYEIALSYHAQKSGLLFIGACGVGKTHLAAAIANRQIFKTPTLFISCPDFLMELRSEISRKKNEQRYLFELAKKVRLLILDDIGAEKSTEWVHETLFVLINYRYEQMLPTIFTTNCSLEELEEKLGKRITSRIIEMCRCIQMGGEDWRVLTRKKKLEAGHD